jgi:DNA-directed RNA polymerase specialized sigma subunit
LAGGSDPQAEVESAEIADRIDEVCRERLNEIEQQVVTLRYRWGMKVDEITRALALTNASGARTHLRNAEAKLRRHLKTLRRETGER